jgi:hypothetical protein
MTTNNDVVLRTNPDLGIGTLSIRLRSGDVRRVTPDVLVEYLMSCPELIAYVDIGTRETFGGGRG